MDYRIQRISFNSKSTYRILQNIGGPCPLIGLCNVLLLTGDIRVNKDVASVKFKELTDCLKDHLQRTFDIKISSDRPLSEIEMANAIQNMQDCIELFPRLEEGLDINIRFSGCRDFEFTPQIAMFDSYNVNIVHGWVVSEEETPELYRVIGRMTYNELVDFLTTDDDTELAKLDTEEEKQKWLKDKELARDFLNRTPQQITPAGLKMLYQTVKPNHVAILLHNNHFSAIYRHPSNGYIFTLVTDEGIVDADPRITWQTLSQLHGDERFVDTFFRLVGGGAIGMHGQSASSAAESGYGEGLLTEHQRAILKQREAAEKRRLAEEAHMSRAIAESQGLTSDVSATVTEEMDSAAKTKTESASAATDSETTGTVDTSEKPTTTEEKPTDSVTITDEAPTDATAATADAASAGSAAPSASGTAHASTSAAAPAPAPAKPSHRAATASEEEMDVTSMAMALGMTREQVLEMKSRELAAQMQQEQPPAPAPTRSEELGFHITPEERRQQEMALGYYESGGQPRRQQGGGRPPGRRSGGGRASRGRRRSDKDADSKKGSGCSVM